MHPRGDSAVDVVGRADRGDRTLSNSVAPPAKRDDARRQGWSDGRHGTAGRLLRPLDPRLEQTPAPAGRHAKRQSSVAA
jgi:hypothetical protein